MTIQKVRDLSIAPKSSLFHNKNYFQATYKKLQKFRYYIRIVIKSAGNIFIKWIIKIDNQHNTPSYNFHLFVGKKIMWKLILVTNKTHHANWIMIWIQWILFFINSFAHFCEGVGYRSAELSFCLLRHHNWINSDFFFVLFHFINWQLEPFSYWVKSLHFKGFYYEWI